jgi:hypothetical protein
MRRLLSLMCVAAALTVSGPANAQNPVMPEWAALVLPGRVSSPQPMPGLKACFDERTAALAAKPHDVLSLMPDALSDDPVKRLCAEAVQADRMLGQWAMSSPANGYGPFIKLLSGQNKSLARLSAAETCAPRKFMFTTATRVSGMLAGMIPSTTYSWVDPSKKPECAG